MSQTPRYVRWTHLRSGYRRWILACLFVAFTVACADGPIAPGADEVDVLLTRPANADDGSGSLFGPDAPSRRIGDCNGDGEIDEQDPTAVHEMQGADAQNLNFLGCDVDLDLRVSGHDADAIWQYLADGDSRYPIGFPATCANPAILEARGVFGEVWRSHNPIPDDGYWHVDIRIRNLGTTTFLTPSGSWWIEFVTESGEAWPLHRDPLPLPSELRGNGPLVSSVRDDFDLTVQVGAEVALGVDATRGTPYAQIAYDPVVWSDGNPFNDDCLLTDNRLPIVWERGPTRH